MSPTVCQISYCEHFQDKKHPRPGETFVFNKPKQSKTGKGFQGTHHQYELSKNTYILRKKLEIVFLIRCINEKENAQSLIFKSTQHERRNRSRSLARLPENTREKK